MTILLTIALVIAGILIAIPVSIWATSGTRRAKRGAGFVVASALLLSFPFIGDRGPELMEEANNETKRKKDAQSGEPPTAGGAPD
jgi:hypothetical protein